MISLFFDDDHNLDFLIEFQGEQHYTAVKHFGGQKKLHQQKYNDTQKRRFCYDRDIPLVIIPYWEYDEVCFDYLINAADDLR